MNNELQAGLKIFEDITKAMDTCPMNPTHIMMNPDKYAELKAASLLHKMYEFKQGEHKKSPNKVFGLVILISDGIDGMYCGKMKFDQLKTGETND